jgi:glycerol uptake facilitator-like aquaporin
MRGGQAMIRKLAVEFLGTAILVFFAELGAEGY